MKEQCKKFSQGLMSHASTILALDKHVPPIFVVMKDRVSTVLPADFETDITKELSKKAIWQICKTINADVLFIVTEAWMTIKKRKENFVRPSQNPDRIERLMVNYIQKNGDNGILYADIHRDENNNPYLTDSKWVADYETGISFIESWSENATMQ